MRLRLQVGLTQAEVAKRVGTTASAISRYENAEYVRYEIQILRKIVEACGGHLRLVLEGPSGKGMWPKCSVTGEASARASKR